MKIVILEDDKSFKSKLESIIEECIDKRSLKFELYESTDRIDRIEELINDAKNEIVAYFLDIVIDGETKGLDMLEKIKHKKPYDFVTIITQNKEHILYSTSHKTKAFNTILKDSINLQEEIYETLRLIEEDSNMNVENSLIRKSRYGGNLRVRFDDIFLIETCGKNRIEIHFKNGSYVCRDTIKNVLKDLDGKFAQCNTGFIIHKDKVQNVIFIDKSVILENGLKINYSNRYKEMIKNIWEQL